MMEVYAKTPIIFRKAPAGTGCANVFDRSRPGY
jgi:hypothetical protein